MVKAFVSNVDSPFGHNLARVLASTVVGSRREDENDEEDEEAQAAAAAAAAGADGAEKPARADGKPQKETYEITGTLASSGTAQAADALAFSSVSVPMPVPRVGAGPGIMVETGDKKKDAGRREAIEKMSIPGQKSKWVKSIVQGQNKDAFRQALLESDVIVYDMIACLEEASWAIETLAENAETFERPKTFIAVSSVMTWARTKIESEDGEGFLSEDEFRRRKPHPNWKAHLALEKNIIKLGKKNNLKAYVIAAGLIYHAGESIFHSLFKSAWLNEPELPCYGDGTNIIPTIHLDDLISAVVETIDSGPESKYLVAVDESKNTLYDIIKAISETLGTGAVKKLVKEQAFLDKSVLQADYDMLTANIRIEPGHIKEMSIEWKYEAGLVDGVSQLVQEYKDARGLWPLKAIVHGPPASGKTFFAQKIAEAYKIHLIDVDQVMQEAVARLERRVNGGSGGGDGAGGPGAGGGGNGGDEQEEDIEVDRELLNELKEATKANNGKYPTNQIINFVRDRLRSMPCRNQGFVLDGFPTTMEEARELFKSNEDEIKDDKAPIVDEIIMPEFIFSLEANDAFVKQRIMHLSESVVNGTKNSEEAFTRRLEEFRKANTDENTVLNFFDEIEIHPIVINVETTDAVEVIVQVKKTIGHPRNYGPSADDIIEERRKAEALKSKIEANASEERARREKEELERHKKSVAEWNARLEEVRKQEQDVLEAQSVPLRNYLMKHVMPTLTAGLIEVAKTRPEDPIDYLAEFLFKHNPGNSA